MVSKPTYEELKQRIRRDEKKFLHLQETENELKESKEILQKTIDSLMDAIFIISANPVKIDDCNKMALKMFGYSRDEIIGMAVGGLHVNDQSLKTFRKRLYPATERDGILHLNHFKMRKKDGTVFPTEHSVMPLNDGKGDRFGWVSVVRDITKQVAAEEALNKHFGNLEKMVDERTKAFKESEQKHKALIKNIPGMIYQANPGWSADIISGCERICGYTEDELISKEAGWIDIIHPDDKERILGEEIELSKKKKDMVQTYRIIDKEGDIHWVEDRKRSIFSGEGKFKWIDGIVFDITDKKELEEKIGKEKDETEKRIRRALNESEEKYQQLFNTVSAGIIIYDAETKEILDGNDAAFDLYGYSREEFLNLTYWDITAEPEKSKKTILGVVAGEVTHVPLRYQKKKDGTIIPIEASVGSFRLNNRDLICGVSSDISKYLQIQKHLETANQELLGEVESRKRVEMALASRTEHLKEVNAALRVLVQKREEDRKLMENRVLDNVKTRVMPHLVKVKKTKLNEKVKSNLLVIESALKDVVSPFVNTLSTRYLSLTPTEIQVATLIREGSRTKEIAYMMDVSPSTIDTHRNNVRKKLGIVNKGENLRTHLLALQ